MESARSQELKFSIGDIIVSLIADKKHPSRIENSYKPFISNSHPDICLRLCYESGVTMPQAEEILFDAAGTWSIGKLNNNYLIETTSSRTLLDSELKTGGIYVEEEEEESFPFSYPLGELLMIHLLPYYGGLLFHACGIKYGNKGMLFAGTSGAGKSTIARLWQNQKDTVVLSDDRIIVRERNSGFRIYGTPWHGDAGVYSSQNVPLEKIFFLTHAKTNFTKKINPVDSALSLIVRSFSAFWDKKGMESTLKFCTELAQKIPSYELGFLPDASAIDFIKNQM
ncbi:MAG: hypothetical protein JSW40_05875 [Candidatus Omnitrophota bacterium]|nr:MAG: hypothetical protein JSW40_05875 [Candidatus Omnitrophota bacterium]